MPLRPIVALILMLVMAGGPGFAQTSAPGTTEGAAAMEALQRSRTTAVTPQTASPQVPLSTPSEPAPSAPASGQGVSIQDELLLKPEPPNEFQRFVTAATGQALPVFGADFFRSVLTARPPALAPSADHILGPGDEVLIRSWGQVDFDTRAVVDRSGNIFLRGIGSVNVAGMKFAELQPYLTARMAKTFKDFNLAVTLGNLRSIQVLVVGQVRRPGSYDLSSQSTIIHALFQARGPSSRGSMRNIVLKRAGREVATFDLYDLLLGGDKSRDLSLQDGDVLYVPAVGGVVAVLGSVNVPAIYELKGNNTLGDVLQFAGGLTPTAAGRKATLERVEERSVRKVEELALDGNGLAQPARSGDLITIRALSEKFANGITVRGNVAVPGRFPWREGMRIRDLFPSREALVTRAYWQKQNSIVRPDLENNITTAPDYETLFQKLYGSAPAPAEPVKPAQPNGNGNGKAGIGQDQLRHEIKQTSPEINWDYASVQRFNEDDLSSSLLPFNLGKAISDPADANNLLLQPGDVVTIYSQADIKVPLAKQPKYVRLEGEFAVAGVYELKEGETLQQLIARVGGFTPSAYLYGAEFTRESAREAQQQQLDAFTDRLERDVERTTSIKAQNLVSPEEAAGLSATAQSQRNLVAKLKQIRATGRVVLGLPPWQNDARALPDFVLEDGDRFVVPYRVATVNVIGAVYNENSFLHKADRSVSYYVRQAGGGTPMADKRHIFVVRADGSLIQKGRGDGWFTGGVGSVKLMPGDTVIIPERLERTALLRGLRDWTAILSQVTLGAAALRTLTR